MTTDPSGAHVVVRARARSRQVVGRVANASLDLWTRRLRRRRTNRPGQVTIVSVSHRSLECLRALEFAVRRYSPADVDLLVIDNASGPEVGRWLRQQDGFRSIRLPYNAQHARAADLGFALARTEFVILLDIDAFPIDERWLDACLGPLREGTAEVSGGGLDHVGFSGQPFVHPSWLAMRRDRFIARNHTFRPSRGQWDVGESISLRESRVCIIEPTSMRGPGAVGTVFGGLVYHNFYGTRFARHTSVDVLDGIVTRQDPELAWQEAVETYLRPIAGCPV